MDFYHLIETLSDEELEEVVQERIDSLPKNTKIKSIGYQLDHHFYQAKKFHDHQIVSFELMVQSFFYGFIPKGLKVIYGAGIHKDDTVSNDGKYYFIDDESYLLDFCRFVQDKEIEHEYELFDYMLDYMIMYFGVIPTIEREEMHRMIYQPTVERKVFEPIFPRRFSDFKGKGNAFCTEYSVMAQNLLTLFGFESVVIIGQEKTGNQKDVCHAFNIISFQESFDKKRKVNELIDFCNYTRVYSPKYKYLGPSPYIIELDHFSEKFVLDFLAGKEIIQNQDYAYMVLGNQMVLLGFNRDRIYHVPRQIIPDTIKSSVKHEKTLVKKPPNVV